MSCWNGEWIKGETDKSKVYICRLCARPFDFLNVEDDGIAYAHRCDVRIKDGNQERRCALPVHYSDDHALYFVKDQTMRVYTDGGYRSEVGGWGWWNALTKESNNGYAVPATNQRMELYAALDAIDRYLDEPRLVILSDSAYLVSAMSNKWYKRWEKNGWRNVKGEPIANQDLWEGLIKFLNENPTIRFEKVKGHSGDPGNERADQLATAAIMGYLDARRRIDERREILHVHCYILSETGEPNLMLKDEDWEEMAEDLRSLHTQYPDKVNEGYEAEAFAKWHETGVLDLPKTDHVVELAEQMAKRASK